MRPNPLPLLTLALLLALVLAAPLGVRAQQVDSLRLRLAHLLAPRRQKPAAHGPAGRVRRAPGPVRV